MDLRIEEGVELLLFLDEELWRKVDKALFSKALKQLPAQVTKEDFFAMEMRLAKSYALRVLSQRMHFSHELMEKMKRKGFCASVAAQTITYCTEKGYLNDREQALRVIEGQQRRGKGKRAIALKLRSKMQSDEIPSCLEEGESEERVLEMQLVKMRKKMNLADPHVKRKAIAKLMRNGFSYELIAQALAN